ncbi:MAG: GNAT family N-acetyltransferase [Planctomycetota bacterium]|jgi:GNAT superfamily N-acetyltransferase
MTPIVSVPADRVRYLWPPGAGRRELRAVVDGVLDGGLGEAWADDRERPRAARLDVGCYRMLAGETDAPLARALVEGVAAPCEIVFRGEERWRALVTDVHGARLEARPMQEYDPSALDAARLARLSATVPAGYTLLPLDAALAAQLGPDLAPNALRVFPDAASFARQGLGYGAVQDGQLVCAASSYTISPTSLELAIATHAAHRGRGLGRVVAARLAAEALARGIAPHWSAANPISQRMALALGYREAGVCEAWVLP